MHFYLIVMFVYYCNFWLYDFIILGVCQPLAASMWLKVGPKNFKIQLSKHMPAVHRSDSLIMHAFPVHRHKFLLSSSTEKTHGESQQETNQEKRIKEREMEKCSGQNSGAIGDTGAHGRRKKGEKVNRESVGAFGNI